MKRTTLTILLCLLLTSLNLYAQKKAIVLHYDFKTATGNIVPDRSPSHADAVLMNHAYIKNGYLLLDEPEAYLDMTAKAGEIVKNLSDFTIHARYRMSTFADVSGYGYFLWCFSTLPANQEKEGPYHAYRVNEQRCETSVGGWSQETGIQKSCVTDKGRWVNVVFRQKGQKGELYIDGQLVGTETGFPLLSTIFTVAPCCNWIGRAPFAGDKYLSQTQVSDFRIYNIAVSDKVLKKLSPNKKN